MTALVQQRTNAPLAEWIVCGGAQRDVRGDGGVECPLTGEVMALEECLACHYLTWATGERDRPDPCGLDELS